MKTSDIAMMKILAAKSGGGGGASALNDLSDVNIGTTKNRQYLQFNDGEWGNVDDPLPFLAAVTHEKLLFVKNGKVKLSSGNTIYSGLDDIDVTKDGYILAVSTDPEHVFVGATDIIPNVDVTIDRMAKTASVENYAGVRAKLVKRRNIGRLVVTNFTVPAPDYMGQGTVTTYFEYKCSTRDMFWSPMTDNSYDFYEGHFESCGYYYRAVIKLDQTTGTGTYEEQIISSPST